MTRADKPYRVALIEAGSPGLNIYSHVAMGRGIGLLATVLRDHGYDGVLSMECEGQGGPLIERSLKWLRGMLAELHIPG